jgi:hypothetical protein
MNDYCLADLQRCVFVQLSAVLYLFIEVKSQMCTLVVCLVTPPTVWSQLFTLNF